MLKGIREVLETMVMTILSIFATQIIATILLKTIQIIERRDNSRIRPYLAVITIVNHYGMSVLKSKHGFSKSHESQLRVDGLLVTHTYLSTGFYAPPAGFLAPCNFVIRMMFFADAGE